MSALISYESPLKFIQMFRNFYRKFKRENPIHGLCVLNVDLDNNDNIFLDILIRGIKNQIIKYSPEDIVFNDHLLTQFSPCDVRAITYLSFRKQLNKSSESPLCIQKQLFKGGKTVFLFLNKISQECFERSAIEAYQDYNLLNQVDKREMINIVSTAVQEQAFEDFKNIGGL